MQVQIAGLPWFDRDDYDSFRQALPARAWHRSYDDWLAAAKQTQQRLERQGIRTVQAPVRSADFIAWCNAIGVDVDSHALVRYANEYASRAYLGTQSQ